LNPQLLPKPQVEGLPREIVNHRELQGFAARRLQRGALQEVAKG